jgi:hypothetical protein
MAGETYKMLPITSAIQSLLTRCDYIEFHSGGRHAEMHLLTPHLVYGMQQQLWSLQQPDRRAVKICQMECTLEKEGTTSG